MNKRFRLLILITTFSYVIWFLQLYNVSAIYDQSILNALTWNGYGSKLTFLNGWVFLGMYLSAALGLWLFINEARFFFLGLVLFNLAALPFSGLSVQSSLDTWLLYISNVSDGIILYMSFFSPVAKEFESIKTMKWPQDTQASNEIPLEELSHKDQFLTVVRTYKAASWTVAIIIGFFLSYAFSFVQESDWFPKIGIVIFHQITSIADRFSSPQRISDLHVLLVNVAGNAIIDFIASLVPAIVGGLILVYIFQRRAISLCFWSAGMFFVMKARCCLFSWAPDPGIQVSSRITSLMGTIIPVVILFLVVYLIQKIKARRKMY